MLSAMEVDWLQRKVVQLGSDTMEWLKSKSNQKYMWKAARLNSSFPSDNLTQGSSGYNVACHR